MKSTPLPESPSTSVVEASLDSQTPSSSQTHLSEQSSRLVTWRSIFAGLLLTAVVAWLNCYVETLYKVHFVGGIQMPFAAVFMLLFLILFINWPLRLVHRFAPFSKQLLPALSSTELMTIYCMMLFAALISTPGADNHFLLTGPGLFYFSTQENGWAALFYKNVPSWFAPGWDGQVYQEEVINRFFLGGLSPDQIPWHAWTAMLIAWSIFLLLIYSTLFFTALIFRKPWVKDEALTFPLIQLPLQMVETDNQSSRPPGRVFWGNCIMWMGFILAAAFHFLKGMNAHHPDWPVLPVNIFDGAKMEFTEYPWNAVPPISAELYLGGIGLAYLLTREVSFSFWFFFLFMEFEYGLVQILGFPVASLGKAGIMGRPNFLIFQGIGGWLMMAVLLIWTARHHLAALFREAFATRQRLASRGISAMTDEPFSARFTVFGFLFSICGLLAWSSFAGINAFFAGVFFLIFICTSLVLTRLVIEGGFLFPQSPYFAKEWMTTGIFGTAAIGSGNLTRLAFIEPVILFDMRTNTLPGFLHTLKIADALGLDRANQRRLLGGVASAIIVALAVTIWTSLTAMYSKGGLVSYAGSWGQTVFQDTAGLLRQQAGVTSTNVIWTMIGAGLLWGMVIARSRLVWFPLHPLGYLAAPAYPISRLWFSFLVGWLVKSLIMKYGSSDSYNKLRPFFIGLIFGNLTAMVFWMIVGFFTDNQIQYWPA